MAYLGEIGTLQLPNGDTLKFKDIVAREQLSHSLPIVKVDTLPTADSTTVGKMYIVPHSGHDPATNDIFDEYVTVVSTTTPATYSWEKIGNTDINLSGYSLKTHTHSYSGTTAAGSAHNHTIGKTTKYLHTSSGTISKSKLATTTVKNVGSTSVPNLIAGTAINPFTTLNTTASGGTAVITAVSTTTLTYATAGSDVTVVNGLEDNESGNIVKDVTFSSVNVATTTDTAQNLATGAVADSDANGASVITAVTVASTVATGSITNDNTNGTVLTDVSGSVSCVTGRTGKTVGSGSTSSSTSNSDILKGASYNSTTETLVLSAATLDSTTIYEADAPASATVSMTKSKGKLATSTQSKTSKKLVTASVKTVSGTTSVGSVSAVSKESLTTTTVKPAVSATKTVANGGTTKYLHTSSIIPYTAGDPINVATVGSDVTVATGQLDASDTNGADVLTGSANVSYVSGVEINTTSSGGTAVVTSVNANTGDESAHTHTYSGTTSADNS